MNFFVWKACRRLSGISGLTSSNNSTPLIEAITSIFGHEILLKRCFSQFPNTFTSLRDKFAATSAAPVERAQLFWRSFNYFFSKRNFFLLRLSLFGAYGHSGTWSDVVFSIDLIKGRGKRDSHRTDAKILFRLASPGTSLDLTLGIKWKPLPRCRRFWGGHSNWGLTRIHEYQILKRVFRGLKGGRDI